MSKLTLASRLADEIGTTVPHAKRFIDDVGVDTARNLADDVAAAGDDGGGQLISDGFRGTLARAGLVGGGVGTAVGGGALAWRQQDVWQEQAEADEAEAAASQREAYSTAIKRIIESDLDPDVKSQLAEGAARTTAKQGSQDSEDGGLLPDDPQTLLILIIVMALVLKFALDSGVEVKR